jgi:hypothetical protein
MTYAIEKNIFRERQPRSKKYDFPLAEMESGDSFFVPSADIANINGFRSAFYMQTHSLNFRLQRLGKEKRYFSSRKVDGGIRVWRDM